MKNAPTAADGCGKNNTSAFNKGPFCALVSHNQVKIPARLLQKPPAGLLHCLCISLPTTRHTHPLLVLEERWRTDTAESFRQETICHLNQSLVMHRWLQAHTPPGLLLKLCE